MTGGEVLDVARESVFVMLQVGGPLMAVALVVGLGVALVQALTQIQEMTLTFVPKMAVMFLALLILLPFMGAVLGSFMMRMADRIANLG